MDLLKLFFDDEDSADGLPPFIGSIDMVRGVRIVRLQGDVGMDIGDTMQEWLKRGEDQYGPFNRPMLVDFANTTECDTATVAFLIEALQRRPEHADMVGIINPPKDLIAELEIAKLEVLFKIFDSEDAAIESLSPHAAD